MENGAATLPEGYRLTDDLAEMDVEAISAFVRRSYWGEGRPQDGVLRSFEASVCVGVLEGDEQAAFARGVSDGEFFGWLADVIVWPEHRGQGLGVAVVDALLSHPRLARVQRWILATRDAHGLYERFGFERSVNGNLMNLRR